MWLFVLNKWPTSQPHPSLRALSACHGPDRLHRSYCVSPGRYVYFRRPPISWLLINQHFPWFCMSHKLSPSAPWRRTGGFTLDIYRAQGNRTSLGLHPHAVIADRHNIFNLPCFFLYNSLFQVRLHTHYM